MGCDIHLFAEGYTADVRGKTLWNRETGNRRWKNIEHWYRDDVWAVKDTSLAATIQVPELFRQAQLITSRTLEVFTMYLAASLIYWIMATVLSTLQNHFENQLNRQEREPK